MWQERWERRTGSGRRERLMSRFVPQTWQQLIPRWGIEGLTARVAETGRTGWYCRVMQEGMVEPGMFVTLIERPYCFN